MSKVKLNESAFTDRQHEQAEMATTLEPKRQREWVTRLLPPFTLSNIPRSPADTYPHVHFSTGTWQPHIVTCSYQVGIFVRNAADNVRQGFWKKRMSSCNGSDTD